MYHITGILGSVDVDSPSNTLLSISCNVKEYSVREGEGKKGRKDLERDRDRDRERETQRERELHY